VLKLKTVAFLYRYSKTPARAHLDLDTPPGQPEHWTWKRSNVTLSQWCLQGEEGITKYDFYKVTQRRQMFFLWGLEFFHMYRCTSYFT
jgi:hypothetical protein